MTPHEKHCIDNADHFTTVRGRVPSTWEKRIFERLKDAEHYASWFEDGCTMIYAVTSEGRDAHIKNA